MDAIITKKAYQTTNVSNTLYELEGRVSYDVCMARPYRLRDNMSGEIDKKKKGPVGSTTFVLLPTPRVDCARHDPLCIWKGKKTGR